MAGGKQSPRQKMINLMYLVFIAMLALNMSKEVLTAFGLIDKNLSESTEALAEANSFALADLKKKAGTNASQYAEQAATAEQVSKLTDDYYAYLESVKGELMGTLEEGSEDDYETQDKADYLNEAWFNGDKLKPEGQKFIDNMNNYRTSMASVLGDSYPEVMAEVNEAFKTDEEENRDGKKVPYLNYHFEGYPLIASKTKLTLLQNELKNIESDVMSKLLQGKLIEIASVNNYEAIVSLDKSAFFNGETVSGKVVLGRYDDTTVPNKVIINGREIPKSEIVNGQVPLKFGSGGVGEKKITGEMQFVEGDSTIVIPIKGEYAVIPKPNSATIKADKMNVVYRGVDNPMTVSFAGIPSNKVKASAPGLSPSGKGYVMRPTSGSEVKITVTGELPSGERVTDSETFRIKDLPRPIGTISREYIDVKKNRSNLAVSTVGATFGDDFDFELTPRVTEFLFKVPGAPSVKISGTKLNGAAKSNLNKARKGDIVQFAGIRATVPGVKLKAVTPVAVELLD